jgi:hypothetical protein
LIFTVMVETIISRLLEQIQDGGNISSTEMEISSTSRMAKYLMFKMEKINNKLMLECTERQTRSISNLISFTLMKCQTHQEEEK